MNILFIGNSYTNYNNMPFLFEKLCIQNGHDVNVCSVTHGGHKLYQFVDNHDQYTKQIEDLIKYQTFDIGFLQENSTFSVLESDSFLDGVSRLTEKLRASVNQFVLYETWGRKNGSDLFPRSPDLLAGLLETENHSSHIYQVYFDHSVHHPCKY